MSMSLSVALTVPLWFAAPSSAQAEPEVAAGVDEIDEIDEIDDAIEAGEAEPVDPFIAAVVERMTPAARERFETMDEAAFQKLVARAEAGDSLDFTDQAILDAFTTTYREQLTAQFHYQTGDVSIGDGLAVLHLGDALRYLGPDDAKKLLEDGWNNPPGPAPLGMIIPAELDPLDPDRGWGVVITFAADGYVEDDDADDLDYDELLAEMKEATESENPGRQAQGYPPMHLVGWAEPPHYDEATHRLYWAKNLSVDGGAVNSLNYAIRVLGRRGVLELNAVANMPQLAEIKPAMERVLETVEFSQGHRYEDFDPDLDTVAAYGIGGLIAGKLLAKVGLWAALLKILIAAKKAIIVGLIALAAGIRALLRRRRRDDDAT
jgi:uncharacterized membrane-anchored protein